MKSISAAAFMLCLLLAGCDSGNGQRDSGNPLDREREEQAVVEERATRNGDMIAERPVRDDSGRRVVREERSLLLQFLVSWWWWLGYYAIGVLVGLIIYRDAKKRTHLALNIRPVWWFAITIFDAAFGLLVYWVLNYSNLASRPAGEKSESTF